MFKRIFIFTFFLFVNFLFFTSPIKAFSGSGVGTSANPYQITTCSQLQEMNDSFDSTYVLMNDIDCDGFAWTPIATGTGTSAFTGSLEGNYHSISNISYQILSTDKYVGLFGKIDDAEVKNLYLKNFSIQNNGSEHGSLYVGALAGATGLVSGQQNGTGNSLINNVHVIGGSLRGSNYIGGLIGEVMSSTDTIIYSSSSAAVSGDSNIGGLIALCRGSVNDSFSSGDVGSSASSNVGGLIGQVEIGANIQRCHTSSNVYGEDNLGGFVANVVSTSPGTGSSFILESYALGNVTENGSYQDGYDVGGFVGNDGSGTIENCYSFGTVTSGDPSESSGGFAGEINNSNAVITHSYWNSVNTLFTSNNIGTSLSTTQMKSASNFNSWDFDTVWQIDSNSVLNNGYPFSRSNLQNYLLSSATSAEASSTLTIPSADNSALSIWLAPYGTSTFTESSTMTKTSGTSTSISVPSTAGTYALYFDNDGAYSNPSYLSLTVTAATPTPTSSPSSNNSPSNNSSNSNGWAAPACNDAKPLSAPDLFQINLTQNTAKLFFTPISNTNQYVISFSTKANAEENGATVTLAREGVQNFTINLLKPSTTYYFKVRGQNGCMPGDWSNIFKVTTNSRASNQIVQYYEKFSIEKALPVISAKLSTKVNSFKTVTSPSPSKTIIPTETITKTETNSAVNNITPSPTPTQKKKCFLWWCF